MRRTLLWARLFVLAAAGLAYATAAQAADPSDNGKGPGLGEQTVEHISIGVAVKAESGPCRGIYATLPIPTDWPEQEVRTSDDKITPNVRNLRTRTISGTVKQMVVQIPFLQTGEEAHAVVTFEVKKRSITAPEDTSIFQIPEKFDRRLGPYLGSSPLIETRHRRIQELGKELAEKSDTAWGKVETIYDWVRDNVEYKEGPLKGAVAALNDGVGDCEELTSLFIALCRVNKIPARVVWVQGHCYPEFYLLDDEGEGHWFPCQAAGTRAFGSMDEPRPILQKGDNFKVPEKRQPVRYVSEYLTGKGGSPRVKWIREMVLGDGN